MILNEISRGITHIEDLGIHELLGVVSNIADYIVTEKVDGSQILFGIDENGFYTSRETKGGQRVYEVSDYEISFATSYMRSAHMLLESNLERLQDAGMRLGDQVEAEVLYGELPNVVRYARDVNHLIFLRTTEGDVSINNLRNMLKETSVSLIVPYSSNGKDIELREDTNNWLFSTVPYIQINETKINAALVSPIATIMTLLKTPSGINEQPNRVIESLSLNKRPDWCEKKDWKYTKQEIKEKREEVREMLAHSVTQIKEVLLNHIVRSHSSAFGPLIEDGGWIEGAVLRHRTTGKMTKLVDKKTFGAIREFAWAVRNRLTESARTPDDKASFMGNMNVIMASAIGQPLLGTTQARKCIDNLDIALLTESIDTKAIASYWLSLIDQRRDVLVERLARYNRDKSKYRINVSLSENKQISLTYEGSIDTRTKEVFASIFRKLDLLERKIYNAQTQRDIVCIMTEGVKVDMRADEAVSLSDVLRRDQYVKLLRKIKSDTTHGINVTRLKNTIIQSWKKGMKSRKHYDDLLSTVDLSLSKLIK